MNLAQAIQQRRSIRKFKDLPVLEASIQMMLEAAVCAPSAANRQPWRFMVLRDPALRRRLAACTQAAIDEAAGSALPGYERDYRSYCRNFLHFEQAPVLIVALFKAEATLAAQLQEGTPAQGRMSALEVDGNIISVAMAVQNLLLSATDQGLGACVMTGPLIAGESLERVLSVPEGWKILCLACVGYPDESPQPTRKRTVEQVVIQSR